MDRNSVNWRGYIPAITTPFDEHGDFDAGAFERLLGWLHDQGMHGLIVAGTQGEWFSLSADERHELFRIAGRLLAGRTTLIAGCTAFTAREVAAHAAAAARAGFDGVLVTPPPYAVPGHREIVAFYRDVSAAVDLPVCVYNWPPGTNIDMSRSLLAELAELDKVVAIKNSTANLGHFMDVFFALKDKVRVFGIPMNTLGVSLVTEHGADGTMGAGAVLGRELADFFNCAWRGDTDQARRLGERNDHLMRAWFHEDYTGRFGSAQAIFKAALNLQGLPGGWPRRPLLPLDESGLASVRGTLETLGRI